MNQFRPNGTPTQQREQTSVPTTAQTPRAKFSSRVPSAFWIVFSVVLVSLVFSLILMTVLLFTVENGSVPSGTPSGNRGSYGDNNEIEETQSDSGRNPYKSKEPLPYESTSPSRSNYSLSIPSDAADISGITSNYAILVDLDSYKVIAQKGGSETIYPASMTKIMTLAVACEQVVKQGIALEELLTVKQAHIDYQTKTGASGNLGLTVGDQITVENILYLINYRSDTIACLLIAERVAGSEAEFVQLMNQKASSLGLNGTNFVNSTGLHNDNHYTTCADMAAIMAYALDNPMAKTVITSFKGRQIPIYKNNATSPSRTPTVYAGWYSDRLGDNPNAGNGVTITGGKTGGETEPKVFYTFVTCAKGSNGKTYICVTADDSTVSESASNTRYVYKNYAK